MMWNWQQSQWPSWQFDPDKLRPLEAQFLLEAGRAQGVWKHLPAADQQSLTTVILSEEAMTTSAIEGEYLDRDSVQSSIRRHFGLTEDKTVGPKEGGIADVMWDCYKTFAEPLSHETLFRWHEFICRGRTDLREVARYRSHAEPMQVVSGAVYDPKVHFEAPSSERMRNEMEAFIAWFNETAPGGTKPWPALARAGVAHLYFVSIHPFEDGNGRIARALTEKVLAQALGVPSLLALSHQIEKERKQYYLSLETNNKVMQVDGWLNWFAHTVVEAQQYSARLMAHVMAKTKLFDRLESQLNARQSKALGKMFDAGPEGFVGGMSAKKYIGITGTSTATASRDLAELVMLGALTRTGEKSGTRYWLNSG